MSMKVPRSLCIDWEQVDTGNCHQNADLQKGVRAPVKAVRYGRYRSVVAVPPAAPVDRQMLMSRRETDQQAFVSHLGGFQLPPLC